MQIFDIELLFNKKRPHKFPLIVFITLLLSVVQRGRRLWHDCNSPSSSSALRLNNAFNDCFFFNKYYSVLIRSRCSHAFVSSREKTKVGKNGAVSFCTVDLVAKFQILRKTISQ